MAEQVTILGQTKSEKYAEVLPQIKAVVSGESDIVANLANTTAILKEVFNFFWVGFYRVASDEELILGPFQGPLACTRIKLGKGVCGYAWQQKKTVIVPNVDEFDGHIACSSLSKSEIVVPIFDKNNNVKFILDIDSDKLNDFDEIDEKYLNELGWILSELV